MMSLVRALATTAVACLSVAAGHGLGEETGNPPDTVPIEKLVKNTAEYLGRRISEKQFRTCGGTTMEIGNGEVVRTADSCPDQGPIRVVLEDVTVTHVKTVDREVTVRGPKGVNKYFYYPMSAEHASGSVRLDALKIGDSLQIWTDGDARIEYMAVKSEPEKAPPK